MIVWLMRLAANSDLHAAIKIFVVTLVLMRYSLFGIGD